MPLISAQLRFQNNEFNAEFRACSPAALVLCEKLFAFSELSFVQCLSVEYSHKSRIKAHFIDE